MGKKARLRKQQELEQRHQEHQEIEERRKTLKAPVIRWTRRIATALLITFVLLYVGHLVTQKIARAIQTQQEQNS